MIKKYSLLLLIPVIWVICWIEIMFIVSYDYQLVLNTGIITMISSVVLSLLTLIYVFQNQNMIKEMTTARKFEFMPHINFSFKHIDTNLVIFLLKNTGKGPAINVDVSYGFNNSFQNWVHPLILSGETYTFLMHNPKLDEDFIAKGAYKDIFGQEYDINETTNLKEIREKWSNNVVLTETSLRDALDNINNAMDQIYQKIDDLKHIQEKETIPAFVKIDDIVINQPPLQKVMIHLGGVMFVGKTLHHNINDKLKQYKKDDIVEIYCNDNNGEIFSGVTKIQDIILKEEEIGEKKIFSFDVDLEYLKGEPST